MKRMVKWVLVLAWLATVVNMSLANIFSHSPPNNYSLLCSQLGCVCTSSESDSVDCQGRELTTLPDGISFPETLHYASFSQNHLESVTNSMFVGGANVKGIDLSKNAIRFFSGDSFINLSKMESLDLSHNELWSLNINMFSGLNQLKVINLSYNKIGSFFPDVFKACVNLTELNLRYNPVLFIEPDNFKFLPNLEVLSLESTGLSSLPLRIWANNTVLRTLHLGANAMKQIPSKALASAVSLRYLDMSQNLMESLGKGDFKGLQKMEVLVLNHMRRLRKIESGAFRELPSLKELYLSDNLELSKIAETAFGTARELFTDELYENRSLQKVIMRHNALKNLPMNLLRWDELYDLDLSENPWNCDCHMAWVGVQPLTDRTKKSIVCATPSQLANKMVLGLASSDFVCRYLSPEAIIGLALLVALAFTLALVGTAFILYRKRLCNCILRKAVAHKYTRVVTTKDKVDLEWDHGAEPLTSSRSRTSSDA